MTQILVTDSPKTFNAMTSKIDGNKITVIKTTSARLPGKNYPPGSKFDVIKGEEVTLSVADNCKFSAALSNGLKSPAFSQKDLRVRITVDDEYNVIQITCLDSTPKKE